MAARAVVVPFFLHPELQRSVGVMPTWAAGGDMRGGPFVDSGRECLVGQTRDDHKGTQGKESQDDPLRSPQDHNTIILIHPCVKSL
jgi:hypothetical protein